jgi:hypothetical protein
MAMGPAATDQPAGHRAAMTPAEMNELIEQHVAAESAGDADGAVAMYTDDVIHDVVGSPLGPLTGQLPPRVSTSSSPPTSRPSGWTSTTPGTGMTSA